MKQIGSILFLILFNCSLVFSQEVDIRLYEEVPMRDGINLSANIYMPESTDKSYPVILIYTPYVNDEASDRAMYFAKKDYVFISLDLRGRGNSEGEYRPFEKDGQDGYDAVNWISKQPWCNGSIGMMGGSYRGMVQWMTLKNRPEALKTIVPTAAVGPGIDFPKSGGIFGNYALQWLNYTSGKSRNTNLFRNSDFWQSKAAKKYKGYIPFKDWDVLALGQKNPIFQTWISHPHFDEYWKNFYPTQEEYKSFDIPILTITGYFDADQPGAMKYYEDHMRFGDSDGKSNHYLLFGPWSHGGTRKPVTELGGLTFSDDSKIDMNKLHLDWFNWTLKSGEKPEFLKNRVCYYLMNQNEWKYANQFQNISNETITYYLSSPDSDAKVLFNPGLLTFQKTSIKDSDSITNDPLDIEDIASYEGDDYFMAPLPTVEKNRLIYVSEVLDTETTIAGRFELGLYLTLNVPDSDMRVELYTINQIGETKYIGDDQLRLRYREGLDKPKLVTPGEMIFCEFDTSYVTALTIEKGSRLVLTIKGINSKYLQKNYNSGKDVSLETEEDANKAKITVHHSPANASYLKIPIYK